MTKGFICLTAVVDWASRRVLAAKVAIALKACHAVDVLQEASIAMASRRSRIPRQSIMQDMDWYNRSGRIRAWARKYLMRPMP
ncbi:hypothetical protein [Nitrosospira briensis]|uniref:hypothetical protein n=1 Tax=Nitrosospira briensis TaxID=35799 RepID=UPI00046A9993|nr:hypothetical protein [Nitrosospira briensis]